MLYMIEKSDGTVSIMKVIDEKIDPRHEVAKWPAPDRGLVISITPVSEDVIPTDRTFRGAWKKDGNKITHDMPRARDIACEMLRAHRAPLLADLDLQFQRSLEAGAETSAIVAKKQDLRDITDHPSLQAAKTPEELKQAIASLTTADRSKTAN